MAAFQWFSDGRARMTPRRRSPPSMAEINPKSPVKAARCGRITGSGMKCESSRLRRKVLMEP